MGRLSTENNSAIDCWNGRLVSWIVFIVFMIDSDPQHEKHLGVTFSSDLTWKHHVLLAIAAKANRILGLLKRTFGRCSEAIITGYKTMVRPLIEYACPVWNPHQAYLSDKFERIQEMSHVGSLVDLLIIPNDCNTLVGWNFN